MATPNSTVAFAARAYTICFRIGPDPFWRRLLVTATDPSAAVESARAQFPHGRQFAPFDPRIHLQQPNPRRRPNRRS